MESNTHIFSSAKKRIITSRKIISKKPLNQIKTHSLVRFILKLRELYKTNITCFFNSKNLKQK